MDPEKWSRFDENASKEQVMELLAAVVSNCDDGLNGWEYILKEESKVGILFSKAINLLLEKQLKEEDLEVYISFFKYAFLSMEKDEVRRNVLPLCSIEIWENVHQRRRSLELSKNPRLHMTWEVLRTKRTLQKYLKQAKADQAQPNDQIEQVEQFLSTYDSNLRRGPEAAVRSAYALLHSLNMQVSDWTDAKSQFFPSLLSLLFDLLAQEGRDELVTLSAMIVGLLTELLNQISTRRFLIVLVEDWHVAARVRLSPLCDGLLLQAEERLEDSLGFEMDEVSGRALEEVEANEQFYHKVMQLQNVAFKYFKTQLEELSMTSVQRVIERPFLLSQLDQLSEEALRALGVHLRLVPPVGKEVIPTVYSKPLLLEIFAQKYANRPNRVMQVNSLPLLPDEHMLWNESWLSICEEKNGLNAASISLPNLNLQFLSLQDYLLRNFELYQQEVFDEIRSDLSETVYQMRPRLDMSGETEFTGKSRMAVPLVSFSLTEVRRAAIGDNTPAEVRADVTFSLHGLRGETRKAWEALHEHDILFLVKIVATNRDATEYSYGNLIEKKQKEKVEKWSDLDFLKNEGVLAIRGCEVVRMEDEDGVILNDLVEADTRLKRAGKRRILRVRLDPIMYQHDMEQVAAGEKDPYESFNLLIRRDSASNSFKSVQETTRDLLNLKHLSQSIPEWFHDILLGLGDPAAAHYSHWDLPSHSLDFADTFHSAQHVIASFPDRKVEFCGKNGEPLSAEQMLPPFRLTFRENEEEDEEEESAIQCTSYTQRFHSINVMSNKTSFYTPFEFEQKDSWKPTVEFTPRQIEAIRSGMEPGLTMIVGPPGTGKTDVAVQIVSNLYHSYPDQRILLVTRSNHALNDLFVKIAQRDIEKRHLLRLGHGERDLDSTEDFSRLGRVDYCLQRREVLLKAVQQLAVSLGYLEDLGFSCETSEHFATTVIFPLIQRYLKVLEHSCSEEEKAELMSIPARYSAEKKNQIKEWDAANDTEAGRCFPFKLFFAPQGSQLFASSLSEETLIERGKRCMQTVQSLFNELKEYRAFELLRNWKHRTDYILTNQARIIAMTCTHAAIARQRFLDSNFKFDTIVFEEAGQMLELESFIPFLLQEASEMEPCQLKRVIYLGDSNQLPPIIHSPLLAHATNLDQSLFARLLRLGVPFVQLDAQGRSRDSIASLFAWRYEGLSNLPHAEVEFKRANACLRYDYQMINVDGEEKEVVNHGIQNEKEAGFVLAMYQYLRLCGYPAEKITLLTPYNGQKELLRSYLREYCRKNPLFGMPSKISTIDKYQGQQNDIVLLSLVRTRSVGYLRDVRRLLVAVSRARLGLYVFGKASLFRECLELQEIMRPLLQRPLMLQLVENEYYPCERGVNDEVASFEVQSGEHLSQIAAQYYEIRRQQWEAMQKEMEVEEASEEEKGKDGEEEKTKMEEEEE